MTSRIIVLDSGPLGMIAHPKRNPEVETWLATLTEAQEALAVPEVADYEVRRELIRIGSKAGLRRLDALKQTMLLVPITSDAMLRAAEYWAQARNIGRPTAPPGELDADVIVAAQASLLGEERDCRIVVATTNPGHLSLFVDARPWQEIV